jgi:hypothetical protein
MKYININSAIHNFGHSFTSLLNWVDDGHVIDDLASIHNKGHDIEIDWLSGRFKPSSEETPRIKKSIRCSRGDSLRRQLASQNVDLDKLESLVFRWPEGQRKFMQARDDRGKEYKIYVNETGL